MKPLETDWHCYKCRWKELNLSQEQESLLREVFMDGALIALTISGEGEECRLEMIEELTGGGLCKLEEVYSETLYPL